MELLAASGLPMAGLVRRKRDTSSDTSSNGSSRLTPEALATLQSLLTPMLTNLTADLIQTVVAELESNPLALVNGLDAGQLTEQLVSTWLQDLDPAAIMDQLLAGATGRDKDQGYNNRGFSKVVLFHLYPTLVIITIDCA